MRLIRIGQRYSTTERTRRSALRLVCRTLNVGLHRACLTPPATITMAVRACGRSAHYEAVCLAAVRHAADRFLTAGLLSDADRLRLGGAHTRRLAARERDRQRGYPMESWEDYRVAAAVTMRYHAGTPRRHRLLPDAWQAALLGAWSAWLDRTGWSEARQRCLNEVRGMLRDHGWMRTGRTPMHTREVGFARPAIYARRLVIDRTRHQDGAYLPVFVAAWVTARHGRLVGDVVSLAAEGWIDRIPAEIRDDCAEAVAVYYEAQGRSLAPPAPRKRISVPVVASAAPEENAPSGDAAGEKDMPW